MFDLSEIPSAENDLAPDDPIYKKENIRIQIAANLPKDGSQKGKDIFRFEFALSDVTILPGNMFRLMKTVKYQEKDGKKTVPAGIEFVIEFYTDDVHFRCMMDMNGAKKAY